MLVALVPGGDRHEAGRMELERFRVGFGRRLLVLLELVPVERQVETAALENLGAERIEGGISAAADRAAECRGSERSI